jgi:FtsP/CotA-like multicopper oxidase with cupredoxin domain
MNIKLTLMLLSLCFFAHAERKESSSHGSYKVTGTKPDATCSKKEAFLELTFKCPEGTCAKNKIWFKRNGGKTNFVKINAKGIFTAKIPSGTAEFEFAASDCHTFTTDKIKIEPQTRVSMIVEFEKNDPMMIEEKPVIYLYPETETKVNVQLQNTGKLTFTYPAYKENGWDVMADADGTISDGEKKYNYLFWEGEIKKENFKTNLSEGFIVGSDTSVTFLENTLAAAGLNTKETTDFITYWAPRMMNNEKNYVHFMFTNEYDKIASINVTPNPDNILRLYMIWSDATNDTPTNITPQVIPQFKREGFTVVEWGGSEVQNLLNDL